MPTRGRTTVLVDGHDTHDGPSDGPPDGPSDGPSDGPADVVVLLDEQDRPAGTAPRATVHSTDTPLHLAFSCYLLDPGGRLLLTRRAVAKRTWPGVWTNSFCGHPRPGEQPADAAQRRAREELGTTLSGLRCVLPKFRYRAVDPRGTVENELCPVFVATFDGYLSPDPAEVEEVRWVHPDELTRAVDAAPWALSPWLVSQLAELRSSGAWPLTGAERR